MAACWSLHEAVRFLRDWQRLTRDQQLRFQKAVGAFVEDLSAGSGFRAGLRVKKMQGRDDLWEMTWAPDGRATFSYGETVREGHQRIVWHRIGTHDIFTSGSE